MDDTTTTTTATTASLQVPGASLYYEVRGNGPLVALVGSPMGAAAFATLADLLAVDHTVLTTDPRGAGGSVLDDPEQDSTPELRAGDLAALITHLGAGPATVFGSSGGAVTALAMAQLHPEVVGTAIAHEPPLGELLPDPEQGREQTMDTIATHAGGDRMSAWAKFMANAKIPMPPDALEMIFGGEVDPQRLAEERFWFAHELWWTAHWHPDITVLRSTPVRIVVGIGDASTDQFCDHTSRALATALGVEPVIFPGGHTGFVEDPAGFAPVLRGVLPG